MIGPGDAHLVNGECSATVPCLRNLGYRYGLKLIGVLSNQVIVAQSEDIKDIRTGSGGAIEGQGNLYWRDSICLVVSVIDCKKTLHVVGQYQQVLLRISPADLSYLIEIGRVGDGRKNADDRNDDNQLDQGEAG